ncbi:8955_t:CDS:2 [Racocetra fulgida]|uniref:8955_t:CDS:1 n=1 Tax=Racocetra fulgida TaxID=60492 RepID=A0A9N9AL35_9GLOM|nr:8955_t:CDS:2 [Racocetra fulgida]
MATKPLYNDNRDQDGSFVQAIFGYIKLLLRTFALVYSKAKDFYCWVLQQLYKILPILTDDSHVATIITDRELALIAAISIVFPNTRH